jgi:chemotaxis protein MotB
MADHGHEQPIIIKKIKKGGHGGHHGGAWKVAYADFVTAMMAFFLVMWILGLSDAQKAGMSNYFQNATVTNILQGMAGQPIIVPGSPPREQKGENDKFNERGGPGDKQMAKAIDSAKKILASEHKSDSLRVAELAKQIEKSLEEEAGKSPDLKELLKQLKLEITNEGLRIEMIESENSVFFEVGSAKLTGKALELLTKVAEQVGKMPNFVSVEGHTDARPFGRVNSGYTNWELSADRANSARKVLENKGLWSGQVSGVNGFSDRRLRTPENPFDISNRRVSILVKFLDQQDADSKARELVVGNSNKQNPAEHSESH